ncbi:MAG: short-chain dehydrogenase [Actinobacteria bacterium HGW-Actinobacteria-4]|nr:MAG: short-chain dehydrogenase [Actinobacteria bacterium HGW-Actinobacteria-4]
MSRIFITGSAQGIGAETARQLIGLGHEVVVHGRTEERSAAALAANPDALAAVTGDLGDMASSKALAQEANLHGPYDAIVHNAGIGGGAKERVQSTDGLERIFHINVVGPYILTCLMPLAPRMVYLTSGLESQGRTRLDDLQWTTREWDGMQAYSDSKLYDSMLSFELAARHPDVIVNCVDPGWIKTQLGGPDAWDPVDEGAETQVWLATSSDDIATTSGQYVKRREVHTPNPETGDAALRAGLVATLAEITGLQLP